MITRPSCVRSLLFFHVYEEDSAVKCWNVCEINSSRVSSFTFVSGKCTMKVYFWGRCLFFFYIGGRGWSAIRWLVVNLCQSVLEQHNEHKTAAECRCVTADLKCKALRVVKWARNVQGPTLSADAIENSRTQSSMTLRHASPTQRSSRRALHRLFRVAPKLRPLDCISSSAVVFKRPLLLQLFSFLPSWAYLEFSHWP